MKAAHKPYVKTYTEIPELNDRFNRVLTHTVEALEEAGIVYAFIGGIASHGLGRPRSTHDIDVFIRPEDRELTLRALDKHGFRTERTDPVWLYKGFKEEILVDVIFKSKGEIYLDNEMLQRVITADFHGQRLRLVAPEDLVIIKSMAHSEACPNHWHDALALLSHAQLDWDYLARRARRAPRRILSLLLYAQSSDISVPKVIIDQLYREVFGELVPAAPADSFKALPTRSSPPMTILTGISAAQNGLRPVGGPSDMQMVAHLRERLAEDTRTNEMDIAIEIADQQLLLRGEVLTQERRAAISAICHELYPALRIEDQLRVPRYGEPPEAEEIL